MINLEKMSEKELNQLQMNIRKQLNKNIIKNNESIYAKQYTRMMENKNKIFKKIFYSGDSVDVLSVELYLVNDVIYDDRMPPKYDCEIICISKGYYCSFSESHEDTLEIYYSKDKIDEDEHLFKICKDQEKTKEYFNKLKQELHTRTENNMMKKLEDL